MESPGESALVTVAGSARLDPDLSLDLGSPTLSQDA